MDESIEPSENAVLRYLQPQRFENVVVKRRSAAREFAQRRASTKLSVLRKDVRCWSHIVVCRHKACIYNTPVLSSCQEGHPASAARGERKGRADPQLIGRSEQPRTSLCRPRLVCSFRASFGMEAPCIFISDSIEYHFDVEWPSQAFSFARTIRLKLDMAQEGQHFRVAVVRSRHMRRDAKAR